MRIPIPAAILIALAVLSATWWLRTRDMDFMTSEGVAPRLPEAMAPVADHGGDGTAPASAAPPPALTESTPAPPSSPGPALPPIEFGDLDSAPGLAEYSEHASKGAAYLIRLARELESRGEFQRGLLAWERVLDSCKSDNAARRTAEDAVLRIRPTLPRWNIDPEGERPVELRIGTARKDNPALKEAAESVAAFLRRNSDDILAVTPRITSSRSHTSPDRAPIAVYFHGSDGEAGNDSSVVAISPAETSVESLRKALLASTYQIVRRQISGVGGVLPPPTLARPDDPATGFQRSVTRLHWRVFAESLLQPPAPDIASPGPEGR